MLLAGQFKSHFKVIQLWLGLKPPFTQQKVDVKSRPKARIKK